MKTIIFTRDNDIDGVSCALLAKLVFGENCKVIFSSQENINNDFIDFFNIEKTYDYDEDIDTYNIIGNDNLKEYDRIYITDLCITGELLKRCGRVSSVTSKLRFFDHHDIAFEKGVNNYRLNGTIEKRDEYGPCCSLGLFYAYLKRKQVFEPGRPLKEYVEMVRICDTNDSQTSTEKTEGLKLLFEAVSQDEFAHRMFEKISNKELDSFAFTEQEKIKIQEQREKCLLEENNEK